jgi:hypothetical protein
MSTVALVGFAVAGLAAAYPYLARKVGTSLPADTIPDRAGWVNRLFVLAATADAAKEQDVSDAARVLIAALVAPKRV